jgi:hypothetical protein
MANHICEGVTHTVVVWMNDPSCPVEACGCKTWGFAEVVNHCIADHGFRLLHVGTETEKYGSSEPIVHTVAVLGK